MLVIFVWDSCLMNWFAFLVDSDSDFPVSLVSLVSLLS